MTFDRRRIGADVVPLVHGSVLYRLLPRGRSARLGAGTGVAANWRNLTDTRTRWRSRHMLERLRHVGVPLPRDVERVLDDLYFAQVSALSRPQPASRRSNAGASGVESIGSRHE